MSSAEAELLPLRQPGDAVARGLIDEEELRRVSAELSQPGRSEIAEKLRRLASELEDELHAPPPTVLGLVRTRLPWLALFLGGLFVTAVVMDGFEHTLHEDIHLAFFVPLIIGHSGNAGGQTASAVIPLVASKQVSLLRGLPAAAAREAAAAACGGGALALVLALVLSLTHVPAHIVLVVCITLVALNVMSALLAAALPFLVAAWGGDPATVVPPAVTTLLDAFGLITYFLVAEGVFSRLKCSGDGAGHSVCVRGG